MKSKQSSQRQVAANQMNSRKSSGPSTQAGKTRASQNAVRHGLCSTTFIVENEDFDLFCQLRADYMARFGPRDQVEIDLVDRIAHANWNLRRSWTMENELVNLQMLRMEPQLAAEYEDTPESTRLAAAFDELSKQSALPLLHRYAARLAGEYRSALKTLLELRKCVPLAPPGAPLPTRRPNEAIPISGHPRQPTPDAVHPTEELGGPTEELGGEDGFVRDSARPACATPKSCIIIQKVE